MEQVEVWRDIEGFEGLYQVSNLGRIKRLVFRNKVIIIPREKVLNPSKDKDGYLRVSLCKCGKSINRFIHRLVANAFINNPNNLPCINHKDENKQNNNANNLEWCSIQYNTCYNNSHLKRAKKKQKAILQLNLNGVILKEWESATQVKKELGFQRGNIVMCCLNHRNTAHGFKWQYKQNASNS